MALPVNAGQRIGRLAPLDEVFAAIDEGVRPVRSRMLSAAEALGCVLAVEVIAPHARPAVAVADRDGWAVCAELVADAGAYAPVLLARAPAWVESGAYLPEGCDAVLAPDALVARADGADVMAPATPGEGVRPSGSDAVIGTVLFSAGHRLRASDLALLSLLGVDLVSARSPHVAVIAANARVEATARWVARAVARASGVAELVLAEQQDLARVLPTVGVDGVIVVGGTGQGGTDRSALAVAAAGRLLLHGVGVHPGETAGFGMLGGRPVLLLPGRLDAALATWLLAGRRLLDRLAGATEELFSPRLPLTRKLVGTVGLAEVVLVARSREGVEPLAAGTFPLQALARAAGWVLVPPESEGYPSGSTVTVNPLP
jgi:molybdopterin biosynthesis enzyme